MSDHQAELVTAAVMVAMTVGLLFVGDRMLRSPRRADRHLREPRWRRLAARLSLAVSIGEERCMGPAGQSVHAFGRRGARPR
ncbi:MAG TPA: hypothetical protein VFT50_14825 [Baekduia sp.]|nr:hypothetical protein [Baekduia sp.]